MPHITLIQETQLEIPKGRQRQAFDQESIIELQNSIRGRGLLQPLIVRDGRTLVAGERRLRALKNLWMLGAQVRFGGDTLHAGYAPCIDLGELGELERAEAEYDENTKRADLTWQERAAATAQLAAIRARQAEIAGLAPPATGSITDELKQRPDTTRKELIVSRHLDDPEVKAAGSIEDAFKILKRKEEGERNRVLGETVGRTFTSEFHTALNTDAIAFLRGCPADSFDVILTDPIYGMGADEFGDSGGRAAGAHGYTDTYELWREQMLIVPAQLYRITKPQAHAYLFCDLDRFHELRKLMSLAGWWAHRTPLIWYKPNASRVPWPEHGPQRKYELILYAVKGKRPVTRIYPDVLEHNPDANLGHGAQKPVALYEDLLQRSVRPGDSVLDPFMGTGTIFPAAHAMKCRATGVDSDTGAYGIALKRLEELKAQGELRL